MADTLLSGATLRLVVLQGAALHAPDTNTWHLNW